MAWQSSLSRRCDNNAINELPTVFLEGVRRPCVRIEKFVSLSAAVIGKSSLSFFSGAFKVNQLKQQCAQFSVCMCDEIQDKCRLLSRL